MRVHIKAYLEDLKGIMDNVACDELTKVIDVIRQAYNQKRHIFVMGNGGSASLASHFACDINKGVSCKSGRRFKVISLNDNMPVLLAYANDLSFEDIFIEQLKNLLERDDLVIAISTSGRSKNILKAVKFANSKGAITIGLTGGNGARLASLAKHAVMVKSRDTQKIEDMHTIIAHILMQALSRR